LDILAVAVDNHEIVEVDVFASYIFFDLNEGVFEGNGIV
jgi:hypothetical protein